MAGVSSSERRAHAKAPRRKGMHSMFSILDYGNILSLDFSPKKPQMNTDKHG
jgi:hypothetical protein